MEGWSVAWEHAQREFPDLGVAEADLRAYVDERITQTEETDAADAAYRPVIVAEMLLAQACGRGDDRAIGRFRKRFAAVVESVRVCFRSRAPSSDELWSDLDRRLFVREGDRPARIGEWSGRSELGASVKVVTARLMLNRLDSAKPETPTEDVLFETLLVTDQTPELAVASSERRAVMKGLFERAARELSARERRVLRLAFTEGMTIDDIGALHGVHRSSAARWIKEASSSLSKEVMRLARAELRLSPNELENWARGVEGSIDLSLARFLATAGTA
jgi:RNA polymerase sigma-70 factor (ECF subfamily)